MTVKHFGIDGCVFRGCHVIRRASAVNAHDATSTYEVWVLRRPRRLQPELAIVMQQ